LLRFFVGLTFGSFMGALFGIIMGWWPKVYIFLDPLISALYPIPKIAIFPLLMIIFGVGEGSKFAAIFMAAFFPMLVSGLSGVRQINKLYFEVAENYGARENTIFTHVLFPGSLPSLMAGLKLSANMAFIIAISVEIVSARSGLGVLLWFGWQTLRVGDIYAVLIVISILGISMNLFFEYLTRQLIPWMGEE